jgi:hypothetical protein
VPWVHGVEQKYKSQGFTAIGVHSPYDPEPFNRGHVEGVAKDYGIHHPVYIDNDMAFIKAVGAEYHPTFVLVDRQGHIRMSEYGVMIAGNGPSKRFEAMIETLLKEK